MPTDTSTEKSAAVPELLASPSVRPGSQALTTRVAHVFVLFILSSNVASSCHVHTFVRGIVRGTSVKSVASLLPAYPSATYVPSVLAPWFIKTSTPLTHHEWSSLVRGDVPRAPHVGRSGSMPSVMTEKTAASSASDLQVGKSAANIQSSQVSIQSSPVGWRSQYVYHFCEGFRTLIDHSE